MFRACVDLDDPGIVQVVVPDQTLVRHVMDCIKDYLDLAVLSPQVERIDTATAALRKGTSIEVVTPDRRRVTGRNILAVITLTESTTAEPIELDDIDLARKVAHLVYRQAFGHDDPGEREVLLKLGVPELFGEDGLTPAEWVDRKIENCRETERIRDIGGDKLMAQVRGGNAPGLQSAYTPAEPTKPQGTDGVDYFSPEWEAKNAARKTQVDRTGTPEVIRSPRGRRRR